MKISEKFHQLKIKSMVFITFLVITVLYISNIAYNIYGLNKIENNIRRIYNDRMLSITSLLEADRDSYQSRLAITEAFVLTSEDELKNSLKEKMVKMNENILQVKQRFSVFQEVYLSTGGDQHAAFQEFNDGYERILKHSSVIPVYLISEDVKAFETLFFNEYVRDFDRMRECMNQLTEISYSKTESEFKESIEQSNDIKTRSFLFFFAFLVVLVLMGVFLTFNITNLFKEED